tara:strand:+ start:1079 stop:2050 length:972 start_codon:yes stop_codon:yes gene_type:complete
MKNIILVILVGLFCNFANAQGLGNLLGGNKDGGANPLGNLLGGGKDKGANPLGNLLGGDKKNPLGSMLGGTSDGKKGSMGNFMSVIGDSIEAMENVNLGPVGKFMLGRKLSAMVIGKYPNLVEIKDPRHKYVRDITFTILGTSRYYGNYKDPVVIIIDDDKLVNAFAAPGGFIFISTGMLNFLESEDELAFVLAHEIGHIELDHGLNAVIQKTSGDLFKKGAGGMGISDSFFGGMIDFAENGYSKDLEMEADGRGAILAVRAGYDVNAALNVIKKFEKKSGHTHASGYPDDRSAIIKEISKTNISPEILSFRKKRFQKIIYGK